MRLSKGEGVTGIKQEAENLFFGSGVQELYKHWQSEVSHGSRFRKHGNWEPGRAPDGWAYLITTSSPLHDERLLDKVITYSVLYTAAEMVNEKKADESKPFHPFSAATDRACASWVYNDSLEGLDPFTIDEILQIAVYGGVRYPHFEFRGGE